MDLTRQHALFDGVADGAHFYFVHSFAPAPADESIVLARTTHGRPFVSAGAQGSLYGLQFHPEKSSEAGLRVLSNFVGLVAAARAASAGSAASAGCSGGDGAVSAGAA